MNKSMHRSKRNTRGQTLLGVPELMVVSLVIVPLVYLLIDTSVLIYTRWYLSLAANAAAEVVANYHGSANVGIMRTDVNNAVNKVLQAGHLPSSWASVDPPIMLPCPISRMGGASTEMGTGYPHLWSITLHISPYILPGLPAILPHGSALLQDTTVAIETPILAAGYCPSGTWGPQLVWLPVVNPNIIAGSSYVLDRPDQMAGDAFANGCSGGACNGGLGCILPQSGFVIPNPNAVN